MKMMMSLALLLSFSSVYANTNFNKRFQINRGDDGAITSIRISHAKNISSVVSVKGFWNSLKTEIYDFQNAARESKDLEADLERIAESLRSERINMLGEEEGIRESETLQASLSSLKTADLKQIFRDIEKSDFLVKFQAKLKEAFSYIDPAIIANPAHSNFFYKRNVGNQIVKWALDFAIKKFAANIPVLDTVGFVIHKLMGFVADQRSFHQNIFLYYAQVYSPEELGLTKEEVDTAVSSIFESRIGLTGYQESKAAQADWMNYGFNKFYKLVREANSKVKYLAPYYISMGKRLSYAFNFVEDQKGEKIINLFEKAHMFTSRASTAFDFKYPTRILRERTLIYLAQFGLTFLPVPSLVKSAANYVANSFYVDQGKTEGALVGYFEDKGESRLASIIMRQSVNPFILLK